MEDEIEQWMQENWEGLLPKEHPQYHFEMQMFQLIWYDYMAMELELRGRYASEACDISWMAASSAFSYSWLI